MELVTSKEQSPHPEWLDLVKLAKARKEIKHYLTEEERRKAVTLGRELITNALNKIGLSISQVEESGSLFRCCSALGMSSLQTLYQQVAKGTIEVSEIVNCLGCSDEPVEFNSEADNPVQDAIPRFVSSYFGKCTNSPVFVPARCCDPLPGQKVVGIVSDSGQIIVHSSTCTTAKSFGEQAKPVNWNPQNLIPHTVKIFISTEDRIGMLKDIVATISSLGLSISQASVETSDNQEAFFELELSLNDQQQFLKLVERLEKVRGVLSVERVAVK